MAVCPNKNTPQWRELSDAVGGDGTALAAFILNDYEIPSVEDAKLLLTKNSGKDVKFSDEAAQSLKDKKLARVDEQLEVLDRVIKSSAKDARQKTFKILRDNLVEYRTGIENDEFTVSVSNLVGGGDIESKNDYRNYQEFGTFVHHVIETLQKEIIGTDNSISNIFTKEKLQEIYKGYNKEFTVKKLVEDGKIVQPDQLYNMINNLVSNLQHYVSLGHTILPEISITTKDKQGRSIVGRLDILTIDRNGKTNILDIKTKLVNAAIGVDSLNKEYPIHASNFADNSFAVGKRNAYQNWDLQLGVYARMLEKLGVDVDEKIILKLLYAGDYTNPEGQQFDLAGNDTFEYSFFHTDAYRSSIHNMTTESEKKGYDTAMKKIRVAIPIEGESKEEIRREQDKDSFIYNLGEADATSLINKIKDITEVHLENALKQLKIYEKAKNEEFVKYFTQRIRSLNNIKNALLSDNKNWQAANKIGFILKSLQIDMEELSKTTKNIKIVATTYEEFQKQAKQLDILNKLSVGYNSFLEDIKGMLVDHIQINDKNDEINKILNSIQDNIRNVSQIYTRLGFNFQMNVLKSAITDTQKERITEQRKQVIEPLIRSLKTKRDKLAAGDKSVGLWQRISGSLKSTSVTPQTEIERIDFQITKLETELAGIKFDDEGLKTYINAVLDPKSQLYVGQGTSFWTQYMASSSSTDLILSSFTNILKLSNSEGQSQYVNFIEREGIEEEFNTYRKLTGENDITKLNERIGEVRKTLSFDENGNEVVTETRAFADPISEEYHNIFVNHYNDLYKINEQIKKATVAEDIEALRKQKADLIEKNLKWRLENTQMKLVPELYELDKMLPADYKEKRDELYKEKNMLEQSAGFNNSEQLDESTSDRIAEIEVELNKLRMEYAKKNGQYQKYMDLMDKYYDYEINENYFERLKSQKITELKDVNGLIDQDAFDKWMEQNTVKRATQEWYDAISDIWDKVFFILGQQNPRVKELNERYKEILAQYKRKGIVDSRFFTTEDKQTLNEIEELITEAKSAQGPNGLDRQDRKELKQLFQDMEDLQTKVENPYYVKEFNMRIDALDQKWARYQQENEKSEKDRALEQFLIEEMDFKTWYEDNHTNKYESRLTSNKGLNPLPKKYNILTVPSSEDMYEIKPDHKFTIRKLKEEAYNKDYQEDVHGYPLPKGVTRDGARITGDSQWLNAKYVKIRNNAADANFYHSFVGRFLNFQADTTGRMLGYNYAGYEQKSIDQLRDEGLFEGGKNRGKLFKDKHLVLGSEYDYSVNNFRGSMEEKIQFRHNKPLPLEEQTRDGIGATIKWFEQAHINKSMAEIQPLAKALIASWENQARLLSQSDMPEAEKEKRMKGINRTIDGMNFEYKKFVKGQVKDNETIGTKFGDLCLRGIGFTRLGLDLPNQIGNLLSGNMQNFLGGHKSGLYSTKNYLWAKSKIYGKDGLIGSLLTDYSKIGNKSFMTKMLMYYHPQQKSVEHYYDRTRNTGQRMVQGFVDLSPAFFLQDKGELEISSTVWLSVMDNIKVKVIASRNADGTVKEYAKDENGNIKTINAFEAYKENANGEIVIRDDVEWTKEDEQAAKKTVWSEVRRTNGRYADWDKAKIEAGFTGRLLMYYRKYLEPAIRNRAGARGDNWEAGEITYGFYRAMLKAIKTEGMWNVTKSIFGASEEKTGVSEYYQRKSQMAAREIAIGACLYILGRMIKSAIPKDKKDDDLYPGHNIMMNMVAVYAKVDNETRSLIPIPIIGGLDSYIKSAGEFTNANRDVLKVYMALEHGLFLLGSTITDDKFIQSQAKYQVKSGNFKKGDAKIKKDLMDLTGYMNVYELFFPSARVKNSFLVRR